MKYISIFDIVGPAMIGPSSSHTAGAVRLGLLAKKIYREKPESIRFTLYNSFAKTGKGHGTDKGLIGGVLGFDVEDPRIRNAYEYAQEQGINIEFKTANDPNRHPNAVDIEFSNDTTMIISGNSLGAGEIQITGVNGYKVDIRGDFPTLLLIYKDQPGMIWKVTKIIQEENINIATLNCERVEKGEEAFMSICLDSVLSQQAIDKIKEISEVYLVRNFDALKR